MKRIVLALMAFVITSTTCASFMRPYDPADTYDSLSNGSANCNYNSLIRVFKNETYNALIFVIKLRTPSSPNLQLYGEHNAFLEKFINAIVANAEQSLGIFAFLKNYPRTNFLDSNFTQSDCIKAKNYIIAFGKGIYVSLLDRLQETNKRHEYINDLNNAINQFTSLNIAHKLVSLNTAEEIANTESFISNVIQQFIDEVYPTPWYKWLSK